MTTTNTRSIVIAAALCGAIALVLGSLTSSAVGDGRHGPDPRGATAPTAASGADAATYREECGACHVAYPSRLLRGAEWRLVLDRLGEHYGVDATLDASAHGDVARHLGVGAAAAATDRPSSAAALPRITQQPWFVGEHREREARARAKPDTKWSQCETCHTGAADGRFAEE